MSLPSTSPETPTRRPRRAEGSARAARPQPKSTTRRTLVRLRAGLLIATAAVLVSSVWVSQGVHATVSAVRAKTVPAILEISNAQEALAKADQAAVAGVPGEARLTTLPAGKDFENEIEIASLNLNQAAEDNAAGDDGSRNLQLAQGLLVVYTDMIGQAETHYRQRNGTLGATYLWNASRLLHEEPNGILAVLGTMRGQEESALHDQLASGAMSGWAVAVWVVPLLALFTLLAVTHVFLLRRFRRTLNLGVVCAVVPAVALTVLTSLSLVSRHQLVHATHTARDVVAARQAGTRAADRTGQGALRTLLAGECGDLTKCGPTVTQALSGSSGDAGTGGGMPASTDGKRVNDRLAAAASGGVGWLWIACLALLAGAAVAAGLYPRINEYRYQRR
ncbi:membrane protein [Actinoallomurus acanthiterrae]